MAQQSPPPSDNIFVGDLPPDLTQEGCQAIFGAYGTVTSCRVMPPNQPGKKAAALVRFASVDEATWVVENLNGNLAEGLMEPIVTRFANAPGTRGGQGGQSWGNGAGGQAWGGNQGGSQGNQSWGGSQGGGAWGGNQGGQSWTPTKSPQAWGGGPDAAAQQGGGVQDNVFIGDLPGTFGQEDCQRIFAQYGEVAQCRVMPPKMPGGSASALVRFKSPEEAAWVVENLNGNLAEGLETPIVARFANNSGGGGGGGGAQGGGGQAWSGGQSWGGSNNGTMQQGGAQPGGMQQGGAQQGGGVQQGGGAQTNVFISDLPSTFSQEDCQRIFAQYGEITQCRVLPPKFPNGKTWALVRFKTPEEAAWVVENLNGNLAEGLETPIAARFANNSGQQGGGGQAWGGDQDQGRSEPYSGGGKGAKGGGKDGTFFALYGAVKKAGLLGGGDVPNEQQLFIKNLPSDTTDLDLYRLFAPFGAIAPTGAKAMTNPDGSCKGFGFVDFTDPGSAQAAIAALNGFQLMNGTTLGVSTKMAGKGGGKGGGKGEW